MKIAMVTDTYRPRVNGVVTSIDTFSNEYRKMGHEVIIIAPEYPDEMVDVKDQSNEEFVKRMPSHTIFFDPEDQWTDTASLSAKKFVKKQIYTDKIDIFHTHVPGPMGFAAAKWAKKMGVPIINTYHTLFEQYVHYFKFLPKKFLVKIAIKFSKEYCNKMDMVICPSTQMKDTLESYKIKKGIPIVVCPTGIKIDMFKNLDGDNFREKHGISKETTLFLFMGRVGAEKNIPFLFDVLKEVIKKRPDTKLIVAGKGPAEDQLHRDAEEKGVKDNVLFLGYFDQQDWVNCYAAADLFTFSSVTETQGLVVTEAMAAGTPVVAIGEMGVAEVMAGGKGGILVKNDKQEFLDAVWKVLEDKELYNRLKAEAPEYAKEWSAQAMAEREIKLYEQVIEDYKKKKTKK